MLVAVDFGRLFFSYIAVQNAAREATSYAAFHAADTPWDDTAYRSSVSGAGGRETNVQGQGGAGTVSISDPTCYVQDTTATIDCHAASDFATGIGNQVSVSASQSFTFVTPIIGDLFGGPLTLSAAARGPIMNPRDVQILDASPPPSEGPSPSPTPSPTTPACTVPNLVGVKKNSGGGVWSGAGFTGSYTATAGSGNYTIAWQDQTAGSSEPCTTSVTVGEGSPPAPTPTPTASPVPTPTPTPSPSPTPNPNCVVPDYKNAFWNNVGGITAPEVWHNQGFTGTLTNLADANKIKSQTLQKGTTVLCTSNMSVDD
jgi:hypothetical protein